MKFKNFLFFSLYFLSCSVYAQDSLFFDLNWNKVNTREMAKYYELIIHYQNFTIGQEIYYFNSRGKKLDSFDPSVDYYTISLHELAFSNGKVERQYSLDGKLKSEKHFIEVPGDKDPTKLISKLQGKNTDWYSNGQLHDDLNYKNDKLEGLIHTYWMNGHLKREDNFVEGKSTNGKCFSQDGTEIAFFPYMIMPEYPGGESALLSYISRKLEYPVEMQRRGLQGKVNVRFVVNKSGEITEVEVIKSVSPEFDAEAIRVIKSMKKWKPGLLDGDRISVYYTIPITFKLE